MRTPRCRDGGTAHVAESMWGPNGTRSIRSVSAGPAGEESGVVHLASTPKASLPTALTAHARWLSTRNQSVTATYAAQRISSIRPILRPFRTAAQGVRHTGRRTTEGELPQSAVPPGARGHPGHHGPAAEQPEQREQHGLPERSGTQEIREYGQQRAQRERAEARHGGDQRRGQIGGIDAQLLAGVDLQGLLGIARQLLGDLPGQLGLDTPGLVQRGEFGLLVLGVLSQLPALDLEFGLDELALRGDGGVLMRRPSRRRPRRVRRVR